VNSFFFSRRIFRAASVSGVLLLAACPQKYDIELTGVERADSLGFRFKSGLFGNGGAALSGVEVRRCPGGVPNADSVMWAVSYSGRADVRSIRYGRAPHGFGVVVAPLPLSEGCYVVQDPLDRKPLEFHVRADGHVEAPSR
jgi:hypothetical protein